MTEEKERYHTGQWSEGNRAAAKPKWSAARLEKFQRELCEFQELLGFNYTEMGRALGVSGQYVKSLEGGIPGMERQPSASLLRLFHRLRALPALKIEKQISAAAIERVGEIWSHILGRRFRCPDCAKECRTEKRPLALAYWYGGRPNQKRCPRHGGRRKR